MQITTHPSVFIIVLGYTNNTNTLLCEESLSFEHDSLQVHYILKSMCLYSSDDWASGRYNKISYLKEQQIVSEFNSTGGVKKIRVNFSDIDQNKHYLPVILFYTQQQFRNKRNRSRSRELINDATTGVPQLPDRTFSNNNHQSYISDSNFPSDSDFLQLLQDLKNDLERQVTERREKYAI